MTRTESSSLELREKNVEGLIQGPRFFVGVVRHYEDQVRRRGLLVQRANRVLDRVFFVVRRYQRDDETAVSRDAKPAERCGPAPPQGGRLRFALSARRAWETASREADCGRLTHLGQPS